jgi:hypothetical protein
MNAQRDAILWHLERRGHITPMEALNELGCFRLAARIEELRREGHRIRTTIEKRNGKRWARYVYEQAPQQLGMF